MSVDEFQNVKYKILEICCSLDESELESLEQWISSKSYKNELKEKMSLLNTEKELVQIGKTIKKIVPFEAELPSETIVLPTVGDRADCTKVNTCHIDEFLYNEEEVEKLVKKNKLNRHYCLDCNSRNISDLIFISHSMSIEMLQYIFKVLLPKDLISKQLLDIGSRIGAVLYGAYHYSSAGKIIGIEMNKDFCEVQQRIVEEFNLDQNRIEIVHSDVMERRDIVTNSNVIIMNVFDFFVDIETQRNMWYFFKQHFKKGSYIVSIRAITDTLSTIGLLEEFMDWLSVCKPCQLENEIFFDIEEYMDIHLYTVN